jgi:hypothetical protein
MSTKTATKYVVRFYGDVEDRIFARKQRALDEFEINKDVAGVATTAGKVLAGDPTIWDEVETTEAAEGKPAKRQYKRSPRATVQPESAVTGRFDLAEYGPGARGTTYAERPDAALRALLGVKWVELWDLGYTIKKSRATLAAIEAGEIDADALRAEALEALGL